MPTLVFLLEIVILFCIWDLEIRVHMAFGIRRARGFIEKKATHIAVEIMRLAGAHVGLSIVRERALEGELPDHFLLVANHQSLLDIPVLMACFDRYHLRFVGKKELFKYIVLISVVFRTLRNGCIDRHRNFAATKRELERLARHAARDGNCVVVFPEGTRARDGVLLPFHSGAVRTISAISPLPVVTVAMNGGYRVSGVFDIVRNLRRLTYRVKLLSVYPAPAAKDELKRLLDQASTEIRAQVEQWQAEDKRAEAQSRTIARKRAVRPRLSSY